jgi:hypothetical protein
MEVIPQTRLYVSSRKSRVTDTSMLNTWSSRVRPSLRRSNLGMHVWLRCSMLSILLGARPLFPFPFRRGGGEGGWTAFRSKRTRKKGLTERGKRLSAFTEKVRHGLHARLYPRRSWHSLRPPDFLFPPPNHSWFRMFFFPVFPASVPTRSPSAYCWCPRGEDRAVNRRADGRLPYQLSHQNSSEWVRRGTLIKTRLLHRSNRTGPPRHAVSMPSCPRSSRFSAARGTTPRSRRPVTAPPTDSLCRGPTLEFFSPAPPLHTRA